MDRIDLRSDTVTKPTPAMREAMRRAEVGDDGREGDPTVRELEALAADMTGKEAGLFVVSGTMGNTVGIMANAREKGTVLLDEKAHVLTTEMGALSLLAGLLPRVVPGPTGRMSIDALKATIQPRLEPGLLPTAVVVMETTHNAAGGMVLPLDYMAEVCAAAREKEVPVHLDGARLFNASVALGVPAARLAQYADTATFCLSKGLGAPVGSVLVGSADRIARARAMRKLLGGTLRQAGVIAAAGIVALREMVVRLAEDHARARRLAVGLQAIDDSLADPATVETNIVMVDFSKSGRHSAYWADRFNGMGLWTRGSASPVMRLVTHHQVSDSDVETAVAVIAEAWRSDGSRAA